MINPLVSIVIPIFNVECLNATSIPDMWDLVIATDVMMSDYSSCVFDAAMRRIPCSIYAFDYDEYKQYRGVYYELEELPFPYAQNNDEMKLIRVKEFALERLGWRPQVSLLEGINRVLQFYNGAEYV